MLFLVVIGRSGSVFTASILTSMSAFITNQRVNTLIKTFQWYRCELFFSLYILDMPMFLAINLEWSAECFLLQIHFLGLNIHFWFNCHGICLMWFELLSNFRLIFAWIQFFTLNYIIVICFFKCVEGEIKFPSKTKSFLCLIENNKTSNRFFQILFIKLNRNSLKKLDLFPTSTKH